MNASTKWRIVVEPNELMRHALIDVIVQSGCSNYAAFATIEEMEAGIETDGSDAVLLVNLGDDADSTAQGIGDLKSRYPASQVVLLSNTYSNSHMLSAMNAGASGYLLTSMSSEVLIKSLDIIPLGQPIIPKEALELIVNSEAEAAKEAPPVRVPPSPLPSNLLSDRELVVLRCLGRAMSNKLIARECHITESTVKVHVKAILRKIKGKNRTEAAIFAFDHGLEPFGRCIAQEGDLEPDNE